MRIRLRYMALGGLLVIAGQVLSTLVPDVALGQRIAPEFDRIACRSLVVTDELGRPQVTLMAGENGGFIGLSNHAGHMSAALDASATGGTLVIRGGKGSPAAIMRSDDQGSGLWVVGSDGSRRLRVGASEDAADFTMYDVTGTPRVSCIALSDGAAMTLMGRDGRGRAVLAVAPDDSGTLKTYSSERRVSGQIPQF